MMRLVISGKYPMTDDVRASLAEIATVDDMIEAFADEDQCRRLVEAMVWPRGRICPACGFRKSVALAGRDVGRKARPGLYQCSNGECRFQFTVTTRTPLRSPSCLCVSGSLGFGSSGNRTRAFLRFVWPRRLGSANRLHGVWVMLCVFWSRANSRWQARWK